MASLLELHNFVGSGESSDLRRKIIAAITIKANAIVDSASPTATALTWAQRALGDPREYEEIVLHTAVAQNADLTTTQIAGAADTAIQDVVNAVVDKLLAL